MEITRPRTNVEKDLKSGGFLDIRYWKQNDYYQKAIVEIDNAYNLWVHGKKEPYSRTMALDFLAKKVAEIDEKIKKARDQKQENITINLDIDWGKFGGLDKFNMVKEGDAMTTMIVAGMKQPTKTGIYRDYQCKETDCWITIFLDHVDLEKENRKPKGIGGSVNVRSSDEREQSQAQNPLA